MFGRFEYPSGAETSRIGKLRAVQHSLTEWRSTEFLEAEQWVSRDIANYSESQEFCVCKIVDVPEPAKFRILSVGDGYWYTYFQPLQGHMLTKWRETPFATMKKSDLTDQVNRIDVNVPFFEFWCSGDYEAATDLLQKDCCTAALAAGWRKHVPFTKEALLSMSSSILKYPDGTIIWNVEGQLMGHPLSFPLLCVSNLAAYRVAVKRWRKEMVNELYDDFRMKIGKFSAGDRQTKFTLLISELSEIHRRADLIRDNVLVNGDDILFKSDEKLFRLFRIATAEIGLKISVGKNYFSKLFCMINSQVFMRKGLRMARVGYLNQRFLYGLNIKSQNFVGSSPTQVHEGLNAMFGTAPWTTRALPLVMSRWANLFKGAFRPNWFLPLHLGGLGVDPKFGEKISYTREQRVLAAQFVHDPKLNLVRETKMKPATINAILSPSLSMRLVPKLSVPTRSEADNSYQAWVGRLNYCERIHNPTKPVEITGTRLLRYMKKWEKPLSPAKVDYYSKCEWRCDTLPPPPPLSSLRYRPLMD